MLIRNLRDCQEVIAGDRSVLRELLHPRWGHDPKRFASGSCPLTLKLRYSLAHATVQPGRKSVPHRLRTSEVYYILSGRGIMHINNEQARVGPGQAIYIPPNTRQFITAIGCTPLRFLCIVDPAWRKADEIVERRVKAASNRRVGHVRRTNVRRNPKS